MTNAKETTKRVKGENPWYLIVTCRSEDDIAAKINDILSNDTLRADLIAHGKIVIANYSWTRMSKETLDVYNKALYSRRRITRLL